MITWKLAGQVLAHPIDFFNDLQEPGKARYRDAAILIVLAMAVRILSLSLSGFLFQRREAFEISFVTEAVTILILWITWSVANWGISTIQEGEGKFKEILVGSAFALTPYVLLTLPISLLSNVLSMKEWSVYAFLTSFVFLWVGFLLIMKVKILHDFNLYKLLFILLLTIIGMLIIWFVLILFYGLVNQAFHFVIGLVTEIRFRL
ncbi:YIP1 family protein [Paenibacillus hodogayensis]|uniref:YIP1 family protein n=1 Tax=Paenibacillus hodogayensis TaxID=279208 RepID=A0ABV5VYK9_9BACL